MSPPRPPPQKKFGETVREKILLKWKFTTYKMVREKTWEKKGHNGERKVIVMIY